MTQHTLGRVLGRSFSLAAWARLVLIGKFAVLLDPVATLFVLLDVALVPGVYRPRRKEPDADRPFFAWGYPYAGIVCAVGWTGIAIFVVMASPESTAYCALLMVIALPVSHVLKRIRHPENSPATADY